MASRLVKSLLCTLCGQAILSATMTACGANDDHVNGLAPGKGPYLLFAHCMPCFKAYGYTSSSVDNYTYTVPFKPDNGDRGGMTARPIRYGLPSDCRISRFGQ